MRSSLLVLLGIFTFFMLRVIRPETREETEGFFDVLKAAGMKHDETHLDYSKKF
jgi:hypothetical protein